MKGDAIKLDLTSKLKLIKEASANEFDTLNKPVGNLLDALLEQIDSGYGGIAQEDKKSETLKFYRKMQERHLKLSKCESCMMDVVYHLDNIALEINKFIKVLEKQKSRPFGKSLLANKTSIEELKRVTETLLASRTALMSSYPGAGGSTESKDIKLNLDENITRIKLSREMEGVILNTLLSNLLKEIDNGYGNISQTDKKSETLKFYRKIQKLYIKSANLKYMNNTMYNHTSQDLKDVVAVIDEVALEINKFIKVLEKQKKRPFGKSKLANKESIATLKDVSKTLSSKRNLKWRDTTELKKVYKGALSKISDEMSSLQRLSNYLNEHEDQLKGINRQAYENTINNLRACNASLFNFWQHIDYSYSTS